jgi:ADP-ribosyl-[dinitrogen reductase] hydrolase
MQNGSYPITQGTGTIFTQPKLTLPIASLDKIKGMYAGAFTGDALGVPHEFKSSKAVYSGWMQFQGEVPSRWHEAKIMQVGQVSDDSEMSLALSRSLLRVGHYDADALAQAYMAWAGSGPVGMGKNTRAIFGGVKTLKGYRNRVAKVFAPGQEIPRSNGALMRSWSLALIPDNTPVKLDCDLSNPDPVVQDCSFVYVTAVRSALWGFPPVVIWEHIRKTVQTYDVLAVMEQAKNGLDRDVKPMKGWCLHALYCALYSLFHHTGYQQSQDWIILKGGDTDTNACIAGALLGALYGYERLMEDERTAYNFRAVLSCASGRPAEYHPADFEQLCGKMHQIAHRWAQ